MILDPMTFDHPHDDLAVYALDALGADEQAALEAHLATCFGCQVELDRHRETLAALATDTEPPPPAVWAGIATQLAPAPGVHPSGADVLPLDPDRPRHTRSSGRPHGMAPWLAVAAAAVVVVLGIAVVSLRGDGQATLAETAADAAEAEGSTVIQLTTATGDVEARVVRTEDGQGYVLLDNLPRLPEGRTYQLWKMNGTATPISLGTVGDGANEAATVGIPPDTIELALSDEPDPGSPTPTGPIVATGQSPA